MKNTATYPTQENASRKKLDREIRFSPIGKKQEAISDLFVDMPTYTLLDYDEQEQEDLYEDDGIENDEIDVSDDDDAFSNRESYRDADRDDVYYLI